MTNYMLQLTTEERYNSIFDTIERRVVSDWKRV